MVDMVMGPGFEQQRDIKHDQIGAALMGAVEKGFTLLKHKRVHNGFQARETGRIFMQGRREKRPVDRSVHHHARECFRDRSDRLAAPCIKRMHAGIGIEDRDSGLFHQGCRRGFTHADRAGQADDFHDAGSSMPCNRECASIRSGGLMPKNASKLGLA